jgi:hypothetical protein
MFVVSVVCCQIKVSATGRSLVQRSPTNCGVCDQMNNNPLHLTWLGRQRLDKERRYLLILLQALQLLMFWPSQRFFPFMPVLHAVLPIIYFHDIQIIFNIILPPSLGSS